MFMKIKEYYLRCYSCGDRRIRVEVFGDSTAEVKRYHKCQCK
jgi:hypothetical protein